MKKPNIYLVCGYYGVGKTSYINKLLKTLHGNIYVIQNDIGEVPLDAKGVQGDEVIGGCVCCSFAGELTIRLSECAANNADHIIVELSSIAELTKTQQTCRFIAEKRGWSFELHSVTIIDSQRFKSHLRNLGRFYSNQIKNADTLVLTRNCDMCSDAKANLLTTIKKMAPYATVEISI